MPCTPSILFQVSAGDSALPIAGARVSVVKEDESVGRTVTSDSSGRTTLLCVTAPPFELSQIPNSAELPYSLYDATILADGYTPVQIEGIQVFPNTEAIVPVEMHPVALGTDRTVVEVYIIPPNSLREPSSNRLIEGPTGDTRVLGSVYIPSAIIVHLGRPDNASARNVTVSFPDYIKNVASSEIYPTWPENAIRANIYAQISFALNRVFTEWYPSRGYNFNITNSTAFDQSFVYGRNIFDNISRIVDDIFNEYLRRPGTINPLFAEYCDGRNVTCDGLSQWGTVTLANNGYTPINILRRYYGNNIEIATTNDIRGITSSYPGTPLRLGVSNSAVSVVERQLNRIRRNYPAIPLITNVNNNFTAETDAAVRAFQRIFNLTVDGIVGKATWYQISYIYVAVTRLGELDSEGESQPLPPTRPTVILRQGSQGDTVRLAQYFLRVISNYYSQVRPVAIDGIFGAATRNAVLDFQRAFGLAADGIIGNNTWNSLYNVFLGIVNTNGLAPAYPGYLLRQGSRGDNVWIMQDYLNRIGYAYSLPRITADGIFGPATYNAVINFQRRFGLTPDGIIGPQTWDRIVSVRLLL